jgi:hypothetical protein
MHVKIEKYKFSINLSKILLDDRGMCDSNFNPLPSDSLA